MLAPDKPDRSASLPLRGGPSAGGHVIGPSARLCAFALLALLLFLGARAVGHTLGPVGTSHARSVVTPTGGSKGGMNMNMSAGHLPPDRPTDSAR
jgi:hypothetical protein